MLSLLTFVIVFLFYLLVRNHFVLEERLKMIDFYFDHGPDGWDKTGISFSKALPSYDMMLLKFWVWPISSFYPAYHNRA